MTGKLKASAWAAFAAVNAVTLVNSFVLADRVMMSGEPESGTTAVRSFFIAPVLTYENWRQHVDAEWVGKTPIGVMGAAAREDAPAIVDGTLNAVFTIAGTPGAYAGHLGGMVVGAFSPEGKPAINNGLRPGF